MKTRGERNPYFMPAFALGLPIIIGLQGGCDVDQATGQSAMLNEAMRVLPGLQVDFNLSIEVAQDEYEDFVIVTPAE